MGVEQFKPLMGKLFWSVIVVLIAAYAWKKLSIPEVQNFDQTGRTFMVTGANSGVGYATALALAKMGGDVTVTCRTQEKCKPVLAALKNISSTAKFDSLELDLASFASIKKAADSVLKSDRKLNVLINNAGVISLSPSPTQEKLGMELGVNHYGTFLFTNLLLPKLLEDSTNRIIVVSSGAAGMNMFSRIDRENPKGLSKNTEEHSMFDSFRKYAQSKLANVLFVQKLSEKLTGSGVTVNAVHPGFVATNLGRDSAEYSTVLQTLVSVLETAFSLTPEQGAVTQVWAATHPGLERVSGQYMENSVLSTCHSVQADWKDDTKEWLWEQSIQITQIPDWQDWKELIETERKD